MKRLTFVSLLLLAFVGARAFANDDSDVRPTFSPILSAEVCARAAYIPADQLDLYNIYPVNQIQEIDLESYLSARVYLFNCFFVSGAFDCRFAWDSVHVQGEPYTIQFDCGCGFRYGGLEIGVSHSCIHPVEIYGVLNTLIIGGAITSIYVQFSGSLTIIP